MKKFLLMILLIISTISNAQEAVFLKKDQVVPFDGILMTKERAEVAMKAEKSNIVLKDLSLSQESLINYYKKDSEFQREELSKAKFKSHIYNIGYFILGVVITSYAFKIQNNINN